MTMTKRDYELIAGHIKQLRKFEFANYDHLLDVLGTSLAMNFANKNTRFDEEKFLVACGIRTQKKEN